MSTYHYKRLLCGLHGTAADRLGCSDAETMNNPKINPFIGKHASGDNGHETFQIKAHLGEAAEASKPCCGDHIAGDILITIMLWFASNIGILLLNKFVLGNFGFGYPVFLTECHMLACILLSEAGSYGGFIQTAPVQSHRHLMKITALAAAFLLSVVLNNVALRFIPVSFVEEIGALTPAATAALAFICMGISEKLETYVALIPVMLGIMIATGYELSFDSIGFLAAIGGCLARAFKTVLQAILLSSELESMDSMSLLRLMAPIAALMLLPAIALLEPGVLGAAFDLLCTQPAFGMLLVINSSLAFIVNYTNFRLTKVTSALTLQVLGCAKGVLATFVSLFLFGNQISGLGILGYGITVCGVLGYGLSKHRAVTSQPKSSLLQQWTRDPMRTPLRQAPGGSQSSQNLEGRGNPALKATLEGLFNIKP